MFMCVRMDGCAQASRGAAPPLAEKKDNSPEDLARDMENQVGPHS